MGTPSRFGACMLRGPALLLLTALISGGCSQIRAPIRESPPVTVYVKNRSWEHVTVFIMPRRVRLGMVTAGRSVRLVVPPDAVDRSRGLALGAKPVGSNALIITGEIIVAPGQEVEWVILEPLAHSAGTVLVSGPR